MTNPRLADIERGVVDREIFVDRGIYETELGVHLELVANNARIAARIAVAIAS